MNLEKLLARFKLEHLADPSTTVGALLLLVILGLITWLVSWMVGRVIKRSEGKIAARLHLDQTLMRYTLRFKNLALTLTAGLIYASLVPGLRALLGTVLAGVSITAVIIGFAAKSTLANLISGMALAIYRPIRIGDKVTIDKEYGAIEDITLRHTVLKTWENKRLIIPNEKLDSMNILNHSITDPKILTRVSLGVSYDTDLDLARRLIIEEVSRCPHIIPLDLAPGPIRVRVTGHNDSSIGLRVLVWTPDMEENWLTMWWILEAVKKRFDVEGVEIPFPYRTLVYKKDLGISKAEAPEKVPEEWRAVYCNAPAFPAPDDHPLAVARPEPAPDGQGQAENPWHFWKGAWARKLLRGGGDKS